MNEKLNSDNVANNATVSTNPKCDSHTENQSPKMQHSTDEKSASQKLMELLTLQPAMAHFVGDVMAGVNPDDALTKCFPRPKHEINQDLLDEKLLSLDVASSEWDNMSERIAHSFTEDSELMELLVKGCNYEKALHTTDERAYLRGKNEKIEMEKPKVFPPDNTTNCEDDPCQRFLSHKPHSIWDD